MSVPNFEEFISVFLKVVGDGRLYLSKDIKDPIAKELKISDDERNERTSGGKDTKFNNRINWARKYLDTAGLIETPSRGKYRITEEGIRALASGEKVDIKFLNKYKKFKAFHTVSDDGNSNPGNSVPNNDEEVESPIEILENAFLQVNSLLAKQLMDEVMKLSSADFEKLVVKLLLNMGYGSGIDGAGTVTKKSKDGGIDGIIKEDQLGFSQIYIQAKQWDVETTVSKPEVQKFVGALQGQQAQKGLFITTAKFSSGALEYVKNLPNTKVVLVDGSVLMKLMIKHNVGVSVEHIYEVKRVDTDFFLDEL